MSNGPVFGFQNFNIVWRTPVPYAQGTLPRHCVTFLKFPIWVLFMSSPGTLLSVSDWSFPRVSPHLPGPSSPTWWTWRPDRGGGDIDSSTSSRPTLKTFDLNFFSFSIIRRRSDTGHPLLTLFSVFLKTKPQPIQNLCISQPPTELPSRPIPGVTRVSRNPQRVVALSTPRGGPRTLRVFRSWDYQNRRWRTCHRSRHSHQPGCPFGHLSQYRPRGPCTEVGEWTVRTEGFHSVLRPLRVTNEDT